MLHYKFEIILAIVLSVVFFLFWLWQTPGAFGKKLSDAEVDHYISILEKTVPQKMEDRAEFLDRLRVWGKTDDGKPVYMLNVMRFYEHLQSFPGGPNQGTPENANAYYEKIAVSLLLKSGSYPLLGGSTERVRSGEKPGSNLMVYEEELDNWNRILVVRYPCRRAFIELVTNSDYLKVMPYKLAALKVALVPIKGEAVIPELRWVVGGIGLVIFLLAGWIHAASSFY